MVRYTTSLFLLTFALLLVAFDSRNCHAQEYKYSQDFKGSSAVLPSPNSKASLGLNQAYLIYSLEITGTTYELQPDATAVFTYSGLSDTDGKPESVCGIIDSITGSNWAPGQEAQWTAVLEITGGTGRFTGATGILNITNGKVAYGNTNNSYHVSGTITVAPRVFFYIAYLNPATDPTKSFLRAAQTWEKEIKAKYSFRSSQDTFVEATVTTASDFVTRWNDIYQIALQGNDVVIAGGLFTHSSVPIAGHPNVHVVWETGLEFASEPGADPTAGSTLTQNMILSLPKLNWSADGNLELFGCNTAQLRGIPLWAPAGAFATKQGVETFGERGFSDFSQSNTEYITIADNSQNVYLGAYWVGVNLWPWFLAEWPAIPIIYNTRIPPQKFLP